MGDVPGLPVVLRQDAVVADREWQDAVQFPVGSANETDFAIPEGEPAVDVREHRAQGDGAVLLEHVEGEDDVLDGDGFPVVPTRTVAQLERDPGQVGRFGHGLGQTPVGADRLIVRAFEEPVVDESGA